MEEKTNIEILEEFAKNTNREIFYTEEEYPVSFIRKIPKYKRTVYIPMNKEESIYFILYGDPFSKIGVDTFFCGMYFPINVPLPTKLNFRKKDVLDKVNPFTRKEIVKTGNRFFDSKVVTRGNDFKLIHSMLVDKQFQKTIIDSFKMKGLFYFSINETNVDFVEKFKGKSHFCIYNPQNWVLDFSIVEKWYKMIEEIRTILISKNPGRYNGV